MCFLYLHFADNGVSSPISVWLTWGGYFSHNGILLTQGRSDFYTGLYTGVLLTQQRSCAAWGRGGGG